jgi:AcrR family transcriptional regulator
MDENPSHPEQPNGRERLLDAAIKLFGRDGFDGTSVRAVADEAGVSWGLVRFYFKSKDGLRDAAEEYVMSSYLQRVRDSAALKSYEEVEPLIEAQTAGLSEAARFLRRAIMEERPIALELVRQLLETSNAANARAREEFPDEPVLWDPIRGIVNRLGYLMLAPQIETLLGRDVFSIDELKRRNLNDGRLSELTRKGLDTERRGKVKG